MNFFEKTMRQMFGDSDILSDQKFSDKTMLAKLDDELRVKVSFATLGYQGPWNPYVRDFDPTLNVHFLKCPVLPTIEDKLLQNEAFIPSDASSEDAAAWCEAETPFFTQSNENLIVSDSQGTKWIALYRYQSKESDANMWKYKGGVKPGSQQIWLILRGYFVRNKEMEAVLNAIEECPESRYSLPQNDSVYELYNREYGWSPGVSDMLDEWYTVERKTGNQNIIHHNEPKPAILELFDDEELPSHENQEATGWDEIEDEVVQVGKVQPAFVDYLWEEQYDASQEDVTSFLMPSKDIINYLQLDQKEFEGVFFTKDGTLAAFDGKYTNKNKGAFIRKDLLDKFLSDMDLSLVWTALGEKNFHFGDRNQVWKQREGIYRLERDMVIGRMRLLYE